jgi:transcriptional regulator with XRE-family HTH domain
MGQEDIFINGELLRLRREARGWVLNDMATRACMSVKQIRQIEDGGMSSFYSTAVKMTAAKKVGALLGLSAEEVFSHTVEPVVSSENNAMDALLAETVDSPESLSDQSDVKHVAAESAKEAEPSEAASDPVSQAPKVQETIKSSVAAEPQETVADDETPKSKISLWLIAAFLGIAWAGANYWQPQDEPATEPVPPLLVLPAEDAASNASAAEGSASAAAEAAVVPSSMSSSAAPPAAKPMASATAPVAMPVASVARVPAVPASAVVAPAAASVVRPANASAALPAVPSASKAP